MSYDAAVVWTLFSGIQEVLGIEGDFLELGVRFGGSALFALLMLRPSEKAYLVDLQRTKEFDRQLALIAKDRREQFEFFEMATDDERLSALCARRYRWIHIDANHRYRFVKHDVFRFADTTAEHGVLVLDDFFQIRWPDVTTVIYEFLSERPDWKVLFIGSNKIYLVRAEAKARYMEVMRGELEAYLAAFGKFRVWTDTNMAGEVICAAKGFPDKLVKRGPKRGH
jgi:hypothetical protein